MQISVFYFVQWNEDDHLSIGLDSDDLFISEASRKFF